VQDAGHFKRMMMDDGGQISTMHAIQCRQGSNIKEESGAEESTQRNSWADRMQNNGLLLSSNDGTYLG